MRKSWGLKALSRIELLKAGDGLKSGSGCFFQLTFTSSMSTGLSETKLEYGVETLEERALFLACIYRLVMSAPPDLSCSALSRAA